LRGSGIGFGGGGGGWFGVLFFCIMNSSYILAAFGRLFY